MVRRPGGALAEDRHGPGRGAWLCRGSLGCLDTAVRRHSFDRAFREPLEAAAVQRFRAELAEAWGPQADDVRG